MTIIIVNIIIIIIIIIIVSSSFHELLLTEDIENVTRLTKLSGDPSKELGFQTISFTF